MRILRYRPSPAMVVALIALFVALGGVSYGVATGSIDSREIKNNSIRGKDVRNSTLRTQDVRNGTLRFRDVACPGGTVRFETACFESAVRGTANYQGASESCGGANRRLPTASELLAFRNVGGITLGNGGSEGTSTAESLDQRWAGVTDGGAFTPFPVTTALAYRCVAGLTG
jgi:hypothetical protein